MAMSIPCLATVSFGTRIRIKTKPYHPHPSYHLAVHLQCFFPFFLPLAVLLGMVLFFAEKRADSAAARTVRSKATLPLCNLLARFSSVSASIASAMELTL